MTTFPAALATLTAALGEPTLAGSQGLVDFASWEASNTTDAGLHLADDSERVELVAEAGEHGMAAWTLAGAPSADAPLAPLPDAVAAAVGWLRARGVSVGQPAR